MFDRLQELLAGSDDDALRAFFDDLHAADVADCFEQVEPEQRSRLMFLLPPRKWAEALVQLEEAVRSDVLDELTDDQVSEVLKELPADDAVDVLDDLDDEVAEKIVEQLPPEQKAVVEPLRHYDEDTAGGLMNPHYVSVPAEATVEDAITEVQRLTADQTEDIYYIYCVDSDGRLCGLVPPMRLLTAPRRTPVKKLLLPDLFTVRVEDDQEEVKNKFNKYDMVALPVIDEQGHMLGIITHDDVLEVAEEEAEEDILRMAGTGAAEFARTSIFHAASVRARWLLPCLAGAFVSAFIILSFKPHLQPNVFPVVIAFLAPIAGMGGNSSVQISTVTARAMATGDVFASRLATTVARELRIALVIGVGAGLFAGFGSLAVVHSGILHVDPAAPIAFGRIALAVGASMTIAIIVSGLWAMTLPFLFRRIGIDPAVATGPLISTANDSLSAVLYLGIAICLLN